MIQVFCFAVIGVYALSAALQGCMEKPFGIAMRMLCLFAGLACLWPETPVGNIVGAFVVFTLLAWNIKITRRDDVDEKSMDAAPT